MKIIQTFCTKPGLNGHWIYPVFNYLSWSLSCLQLRQFYPEVELYTDDQGYQLLIEEFNLPYTKVHLTLNDFPFPTYLWSAPKLKTYSMQEEPFLHIDGDVFLFKAISEDFVTNHDIVFQNMEIDKDKESGFYIDILNSVFEIWKKRELSHWLNRISMNDVTAFNAGIMGGNNIPFFKDYTSTAFSFLLNEGQVIAQLEQPQYATHLAEQVLPAILTKERSLKPSALFAPDYNPGLMSKSDDVELMDDEDFSEKELPFRYMDFDAFGISPYGRKYAHMIGNRKKSMIICKQVARRMMKSYPDYYDKIINFATDHLRITQSNGDSFSAGSNHPISGFKRKLKQLRIKNIFPKTCRISSLYGICTDLNSSDLIGFEPLILKGAALLNEKQLEKVKDVLFLETSKLTFSLCLRDEDLDFAEQQACASLELLYDINQLTSELLILQKNPFVRVVTTKWNWFDTKTFDENYPKDQKVIVLLPDKITYSFIEFILTSFQGDILEMFNTSKSISNGFRQLTMMQHEKKIEHFEEEFFNNVVYLLANGMLFGHHKNADFRDRTVLV